ncbi:hypothetical protein K449DRAFT_21931 [Hypoxylon sp. EC38]|nr:hypothetical protein K449DRAFT_21931 [Hypoxylon sp. EC38]
MASNSTSSLFLFRILLIFLDYCAMATCQLNTCKTILDTSSPLDILKLYDHRFSGRTMSRVGLSFPPFFFINLLYNGPSALLHFDQQHSAKGVFGPSPIRIRLIK